MSRSPNTPCSVCGKLGWPHKGPPTSSPRVCHACRRKARGFDPAVSMKGAKRATGTLKPVGCANPACQVTIERPWPTQKWCSPQCRYRVADATPAARRRWHRKNAKRRPNSRAGNAWRLLREQVLSEEPDCWICGDPIDRSIEWPRDMSAEADHVTPLEDGGELLDRANVHAAHRVCNQARHVEWRRARRALKRAA